MLYGTLAWAQWMPQKQRNATGIFRGYSHWASQCLQPPLQTLVQVINLHMKQLVPFYCNGSTEKCPLHTSIVSCFTLFIQKSRQTWVFYSSQLHGWPNTGHSFVSASLVSSHAWPVCFLKGQHGGVWRKCYLYRQLQIRKGKRKRKKIMPLILLLNFGGEDCLEDS